MSLALKHLAPPTRLVDTRPKPIDAGLAELIDILSYARPYGGEMVETFCAKYLDVIPGMRIDEAGNRILKITKDPRILWSCHTDTVHKPTATRQNIKWEGATLRLADASAKPGHCLGADDGAGIWLMLNMIRKHIPGLYIFHAGEEVGGKGSTYISTKTPELVAKIDFAIAFDRQDWDNVITYQAGGKCASDAFARSLAALLPGKYVPDDTGVFTDTANYTDLIPECTNLSVGYQRQHGHFETLDAVHLLRMRDALLVADFTTLVVEREAGDNGWGGYGRWGRYSQLDYGSKTSTTKLLTDSFKKSWGTDDVLEDPDDEDTGFDEPPMVELIRDHPYSIASLLDELGVTVEDVEQFLEGL